MSRNADKTRRGQELQLALQAPAAPTGEAQRWFAETSHRPGCQCHRCCWAHGVIAGNVNLSFEDWRKRV